MAPFMSAIGGVTPAIQEALNRRSGRGTSPLNQVSTQAPTFDASQQLPSPPTSAVPILPSAPSAPTMGATTPSMIPLASGSQVPSGDPNATLIIKALSTYLNKKPMV